MAGGGRMEGLEREVVKWMEGHRGNEERIDVEIMGGMEG